MQILHASIYILMAETEVQKECQDNELISLNKTAFSILPANVGRVL